MTVSNKYGKWVDLPSLRGSNYAEERWIRTQACEDLLAKKELERQPILCRLQKVKIDENEYNTNVDSPRL
jgi:hypothetical protein